MSALSQRRDELFGSALYLVSQVTRNTARLQVSGSQHLQTALNSGQPVILTAWHGMSMMLIGYISRNVDLKKIALIIPNDHRGGVLSVFLSKLGASPFPIDLTGDRSMASARKLAQLVRMLAGGHYSYINPDGPDGPAHVVKPGIAYLARKARALILPLGAYTRHGYRQPRWDRYVVPYPFCRISVCVGEPFSVPEDSELDMAIERLTNTLNRLALQAAANYYEL